NKQDLGGGIICTTSCNSTAGQKSDGFAGGREHVDGRSGEFRGDDGCTRKVLWVMKME
ncbi:hypothetical protein A2U01_0108183, partial [Trifolium medium]|nr:hypothetical protein [Trifolium medium]